MARINHASISHSIHDSYVNLKFELDVEFEQREIGTAWFVSGILKERDHLPDDLLSNDITSPPFRPASGIKHITFIRRFKKEDLHTEPGDEEIYAHLSLIPMESPPPVPGPFSQDSIITNVTIVDV